MSTRRDWYRRSTWSAADAFEFERRLSRSRSQRAQYLLGVVLGMTTTVAAFFPILKLTMGHCFFEQGCGNHENLQLLGVVLASCLSGLVVAWAAARLYSVVAGRGRRN